MEFKLSLRALIAALFILTVPAGAEDLKKESLYQESSQWTDASSANVQLRAFHGSPVVVTMLFTGCQYTCPRVVAKLKNIEKEIGKRRDVKFVMISFDHENDTPDVLAKFLKEKKLDPAKWKMLTGQDSGSVRRIAALLDISYKREKNGDYSHSNVITLLDKDGVKMTSVNGLAADHSALVKAARKM